MATLVRFLTSAVIFLFPEHGQLPLGTAFVVGHPFPGRPGMVVPLVVTAKHVVGDYERIVGRFTAKSGAIPLGVPYDLKSLRLQGDLWEHSDEGVDLLVFRTRHFEELEYEAFPMELIASKKTYADEDVKATDRVIFPSLLVNFMGTARNYPVTRDGSIALVPDELVPLEYDVGTKRITTRQEVILIDATAVPGASGSPIFLWPGPRVKGNTFSIGGTKPWLLGIMHGFYPAQPRELIAVEVSRVLPAFRENSGIAIVFPSWRLLEILEGDKVVRRIEEVTKASE